MIIIGNSNGDITEDGENCLITSLETTEKEGIMIFPFRFLSSHLIFKLLRRRCFRKKMIHKLKFIRVIKELKEHFKYMPGGEGWIEARDHFNKIK